MVFTRNSVIYAHLYNVPARTICFTETSKQGTIKQQWRPRESGSLAVRGLVTTSDSGD